jgi:hypothetical protein
MLSYTTESKIKRSGPKSSIVERRRGSRKDRRTISVDGARARPGRLLASNTADRVDGLVLVATPEHEENTEEDEEEDETGGNGEADEDDDASGEEF